MVGWMVGWDQLNVTDAAGSVLLRAREVVGGSTKGKLRCTCFSCGVPAFHGHSEISVTWMISKRRTRRPATKGTHAASAKCGPGIQQLETVPQFSQELMLSPFY